METPFPQRSTTSTDRISLGRIFLFYGIALVVSNLFRFDVFDLNARLGAWSGLGYVIARNLLEGSGVFIGALIGLHTLKRVRATAISFWSSSRGSVLLMALVPLVLLTLVGVRNTYGINVHLFGAVATIAVLTYCIMEEYGWRGYLQEELSGLDQYLKYFIIGSLWYLWHISFLENTAFGDNALFFFALVTGSWGIGKVAELTRSIGASACFHFIVNISLFNVFFHDAIDPLALVLVISGCVVVWIVILNKWKK